MARYIYLRTKNCGAPFAVISTIHTYQQLLLLQKAGCRNSPFDSQYGLTEVQKDLGYLLQTLSWPQQPKQQILLFLVSAWLPILKQEGLEREL